MTFPKVTIALTRYAEPDSLVSQAIMGALAQEGVSGEVLFIDQDESSELGANQFVETNLALRVVRGRLGSLSEARNCAIEQAENDHILFLDSDAVPEEGWANAMAAVLARPECAVVGSRIEPGWPANPPGFARAQVLRDQYSLLDLGREERLVHKVVGAAFGIDRSKLPDDLRFDPNLGRRDGRLFGGEETDFCRRVAGLGFEIRYCGCAAVTHIIQDERLSWRWMAKRLVYAGFGRARQGGAPSPSNQPGLADYLYAPLYLPPYVLGWTWGKLARS